MEDICNDITSAINEPIKDYAPGSDERAKIKLKLSNMENEL